MTRLDRASEMFARLSAWHREVAETGIFRRKSRPSLPPLVEPPQAGQPIILDEEEQRRVDRRLAFFFGQEEMKGRIFPKDVLTTLENSLAAQELVDLARLRLDAGELRKAASSCIKALGLDSKNELAWIRLARAHAEYGDYIRAKNCLDEAVRTMAKIGLRSDVDPWCREIRAVRQQLGLRK